MRRSWWVLLALTIAALVVSAGAGARPDTGKQLTKIRYATSFGNFGRDAFVYVAIDRGYFRDAGFDVSVVAGQGTENARLLAAGTLDYTANSVAGLAYQKEAAGFPIRAVAVTSQQGDQAVAVLADSGINTPKDLEGKTYADTPASIVKILLPTFAKKAGFDVSKVKVIPSSAQTLPGLLATGAVDSVGQFTVGLPILQRAAAPKKVRMLKYSKYLPNLLGNALWTTEARIRTNPAEVKKFTAALLKGENWALDNPGSAGYILQKYVPLADPIAAAQELRILKGSARNKCTAKYGLGYIDIGKMKSTASVIRNAFQSDAVRYDKLYATGFVKTATCTLK